MTKHILKLIFRSFKRFKGSFFINLLGLSVGLACTLLIYFWVNSELNTDGFHKNNNRLYQVMANMELANGINTMENTPDLLAKTLMDELPEVEYAAAVTPNSWFGKFTLVNENQSFNSVGQFAGKDYFNMFSFNLLNGTSDNALASKNSIAISESLAKKIFGTTTNVVGKTLEWNLQELSYLTTITAIFEDIPNNSTEEFDFVLPFDAFLEVGKVVGRNINWGNYGPKTFVVLARGSDPDAFNSKIEGFIKSKSSNSNVSLFAQKYSERYLYSNYENGVQAGGRIGYIKLFIAIAFFILMIACINFMNLSTAQASRRVKEIGIKKAVGAERSSLVFQYLGESMIMALISMIAAILIVELFLPQFNRIMGKNIELIYNIRMLSVVGIVTLFTGALAGSYPALYLSGFNPTSVLKSSYKSSISELWARKGLVIFQFSVSIILIVSVLIIYKQIEFVQKKNLGFEKDNLAYFSTEGKTSSNRESFIQGLKDIPGVVNASNSSSNIISEESSTEGVSWSGKNPDETLRFYLLNFGYDPIATLGMHLKTGRDYSRKYSNEKSKIIINETAVNTIGLKDPIGKKISLWGEEKEIIGVVEDFHFASLHEEIKPMVIRFSPENTLLVLARIQSGTEAETLESIRNFHSKFNPGFSIEFKFIDQEYKALYVSEERVSELSKYFALIAVLISCLGLFGLATFTIERRKKEIGIRKVLGAGNASIVLILSSEFTKTVITAIIISLPLSYLLIVNWLNSFSYRIELKIWFFATAGVMALAIAWLTVGIQAFKSSLMNPVDSLKSE